MPDIAFFVGLALGFVLGGLFTVFGFLALMRRGNRAIHEGQPTEEHQPVSRRRAS